MTLKQLWVGFTWVECSWEWSLGSHSFLY